MERQLSVITIGAAAKAIAFALEGTEHAQHGGRVEYLEVAVG